METEVDRSAAHILAQIDRILGSEHFARSAALSRFLRFVVQAALDGKSEELKEYRLGVDALGRNADFDPRVDPIVRTQAAKLRARLAEYYSTDGRKDPWLISIPKGGYVPVFERVRERPEPGPSRQAVPAADVQSIAVLPFVNMSADPENEYFSDGLTEELINLLTLVPGLRVVARTSVFSFKNVNKDIREIGSLLNVRTVLEGSVRKSGNKLRVTAQLIEVASGYHLLSRAYPRELKDVFAVQEELANAVVSEIMPRVIGERAASLLRVHASDLTAYNLYLKGMVTLSKDFTGPLESVEVFQQVLRIDPNYAPAWAGLAYAYFVISWYSIQPAHVAMPLGKSAAERAIGLDPNLALGHTVLGAIQAAYEWNWADSERSFQRAKSLQPGLALAYQLHAGTTCLAQQRIGDAVAAIRRATELSPFDAMVRAASVHIFNVGGDFEAALQDYSLGIEINPRAPLPYRAIGLAYQRHGRFPEAIRAFQKACEVSGRAPIALAALAGALADSGDTPGARQLLGEIESAPGANALARAVVHLCLGDYSDALRWLEQAGDDREPYLLLVPCDPRFARMHGEGGFQRLLGRMGLASASA